MPVHHLEGHLLSPLLADRPPAFPFVALLVSGGHSQLFAVRELGEYACSERHSTTRRARRSTRPQSSLDCGYPGGPALAALAENRHEAAFELPRPMLTGRDYDFSFSGLKTAVMLAVRAADAAGELAARRADLAASFQRAAVDTLVGRSLQAARAQRLERIVVAGGVGANRLLRADMARRFDGEVYYPRLAFCTDNGAMIAIAGALRIADAKQAGEILARARWSLDALAPPRAA